MLAGRRYRVDTALQGRVMTDRLGDEAGRRHLLESAADAIHVLHRATDHVLVGKTGQLEAAFSGVDHASLLVTDEKGCIRRRIIIIE